MSSTGVAWKDVEPFLGLILASAFCFVCQGLGSSNNENTVRKGWTKAAMQRKRMVLLASTSGLVLGFALFCGILVFTQFPAMLQTTHPAIAQLKTDAREQCHKHMENMNILEAEKLIRDNTKSRELATEFASQQRKTLDRALRPYLNQLFFRMGAMCSVLPFFIILGIQIICTLAKWTLPKQLPTPADITFVLLPIVQMATAYTWAVTICFHFWLRERQVTNCMLLSGHWYTALHTICVSIATAGWMRMECTGADQSETPGKRVWTSSSSLLPLYYLAWVIAYIALTSRVLSTSQHFHHDWQESVEGIKCMVMTLPFAALAGAFVLYISTERAQLEIADTESSGFQKGQTADVLENFQAESNVELDVKLGDLVLVIDASNTGWVYVQRQDGTKGYVPDSFLVVSQQQFGLLSRQSPNLEDIKGDPLNASSPSYVDNIASKNDVSSSERTPSASNETVNSAAPKPEAPTRAVPFLNDIRNGNVNLKKVSPSSSSDSNGGSSKSQGSMMGALQQALHQRRATLNPPEDSNEESSEW
eukprot:CAMPEP_0171524118 /NCGR_PEP_ID=MMETSP0959-20130129/8856_1 /TAXON_ID=87120 /ORGANISM="Aurantiochytrium limacinum, Strain ATCCMYA-1381" /LENGTH=533 /DNA_ID=CAMNT_0012064787 /DNA_START=290 /DNA_END=1888 /DNA_ORIENTATION=+